MKVFLPQNEPFFRDPIISRSFKGNTDTINSCIFSPNTKQAITGSEDGNVFVWNFAPQVRPYKFIGHKSAINEVAINPIGDLIASCSSDETIRLWNNTINGSSQLIRAHNGPVRSVSFSTDCRMLVSGANDTLIKTFSLVDKKFYGVYPGHCASVRCVRFSPDNRLIVSSSDDKTLKLWDVTKATTIHTFIDHLESVNVVRFSLDGTCVASGSVDKKVKVFDIRSGRVIQHYDAHAASVTSLAFHPSGKFLLTASMDSTMKIWDLVNGQILYTMHGHEGPICSVDFDKCGNYFCSGGSDAILMIWKSNANEMNVDSKISGATKKAKVKPKATKKIEKNGKIEKPQISSMPTGPETKAATLTMKQTVNFNQPIPQGMNTMKSSNESLTSRMPEELLMTFEKLISQLDLVSKTMKIMDERIQKVENQVSDIYNRQKRGIFKHQNHLESQEDEYLDENHLQDNKDNLIDTMKYYQENFEKKNVFNENLGCNTEENKNVPVEIFEDVGNHAEEFRQDEEEDHQQSERLHERDLNENIPQDNLQSTI